MSFEGFYQNICANGHYWTRDVYENQEGCDCGAETVHQNLVNDTNCCTYGPEPCQSGELEVIYEKLPGPGLPFDSMSRYGKASFGRSIVHTNPSTPLDSDNFEEVY